MEGELVFGICGVFFWNVRYCFMLLGNVVFMVLFRGSFFVSKYNVNGICLYVVVIFEDDYLNDVSNRGESYYIFCVSCFEGYRKVVFFYLGLFVLGGIVF